MISKKKKELEMQQLKSKLQYDENLREAYLHELKRKDGKYNFVFMPFVSVSEDKYINLYSNSKERDRGYGFLIKWISINDVIIKYDVIDQFHLSLKPGRYKIRVYVDVQLFLLSKIMSKVQKEDPYTTYHSYKDFYQCEVDRTCEFVVNDTDTAYVYFKGKIMPSYTRSKNLFFMDSYTHTYEMRQTSLEHIKSLFPIAYIFDDLKYQYKDVDEYYINEARKTYSEILSKYKDVEIKPTIKAETKTVPSSSYSTIKKPQTSTTSSTSSYKTINYPNGGKYIGAVKNDVPNGIGTYYYPNGDTYTGDFLNGMFNGNGVITYKDNSKYVSFFKDNKFHGKGTKYNVDGTTIDYEYDNGKLVNNNQPAITKTVNNKTNEVIREIKQLDRYYGQVLNNKKDGFGINFLLSSLIIAAVYKNNEIDGPKIEFSSNKITVSLDIASLNNKFNVTIHPDKFTFKDNHPFNKLVKNVYIKPTKIAKVPTNPCKLYEIDNGNGNYVGTNSSVYLKEKGIGIRNNVFGKTYFGELYYGKVHGIGMIYDNYTLLIGEFNEGELDGVGMKVLNYKTDSYTYQIGKWINGKCIEEIK